MMEDKNEIFAAIEAGDERLLDQKLSAKPHLAVVLHESGLSPLLYALYLQKPGCARVVAGHRDNLSLHEAAALGDTQRMNELLEEEPSRAQKGSPDGFTPLHLAAFFSQAEAVAELIRHGADVNAVAGNETKVQPLHSAVAGGDEQSVALLLQAGAEVNGRQQLGFTPLMGAAANNRVEITGRLIEAGADPHLECENGKKALDYAEEKNAEEARQYLQELISR